MERERGIERERDMDKQREGQIRIDRERDRERVREREGGRERKRERERQRFSQAVCNKRPQPQIASRRACGSHAVRVSTDKQVGDFGVALLV